MFTGIVEEMGVVREAAHGRLAVTAQVTLAETHVGDSISVNGVCLTATSIQGSVLTFDLSPETLRRSNLGALKAGDPVNLERPVAANGRLGGHIAQGHVDATAKVLDVQPEGDSLLIRFQPPQALMPYIVEKGFIAVDGVSLTVAGREASAFTVSVIPFTQRRTNLGSRKPGALVNLEVDIIAKYVESLLGQGSYGRSQSA